ncbi:glucan 1,4-alpha-maltohexaosidase [Coccidioides immitis H538.4]|uniref:alpha-amylase n=1 Tax=Coccidioides immitis H538.4 TaxID=396776 RepID=A0A0J8REL4_COCIT|nr:glucan 1,4-alpha-maltohexaosidase [Coccidioides immitis H538.4]
MDAQESVVYRRGVFADYCSSYSSKRKKATTQSNQNQLMLQAFEWNTPADHQHWKRLTAALDWFKEIGVTAIWIPPGCKGMAPARNGYDIYDLYDIGEFDQKGSVPTKWGSKEELQDLANKAEEMNIKILWDAVLNHKAGADRTETCQAVRVDSDDRNCTHGNKPIEIESWLGFEFSRAPQCLQTGIRGIYKIIGDGRKNWASDVSKERGNFDYLMFANIDFSNEDVKDDVKNWIQWLSEQVPIGGLRLDAVKHYSRSFLIEFILHIKNRVGLDWFFVAEYWKNDINELLTYLEQMKNLVSLFDVPLAHNISRLSRARKPDLRKVFHETLLKKRPEYAVTFVTNHDTQLGQSLEKGYPCLFYGDLYGINAGFLNAAEGPLPNLGSLALGRSLYAYGSQRDYFFQKHCIGFVRYGDADHPSGLACVMSSTRRSFKFMYVGRNHAGEKWTEIYGQYGGSVKINRLGYGSFGVMPKSVSIWVSSEAQGRDKFPVKNAHQFR